jgi:putative nucleotidyltransferase with HDIG domain
MELDPEDVEIIRRAAMMHDIGKIGVPDAVLRKPGPLTPQERTIMEQHVLIGTRMLDRLGFLGPEIPIIRHHHERWDGKGYPDGIAGDGIPLGARLLAVADAFDAITSDRIYRRARDLPTAMGILSGESRRQFNPEAVDAMAQWLGESAGNVRNTGPTTS